ncbi:terpene synthase family protein [Streptomyces pathocidini]|uniref:terpene synthase family protein n=1 Tax=Streptomyces pathocidini TaxID=1650571 RepID=UPI0033C8F7F9
MRLVLPFASCRSSDVEPTHDRLQCWAMEHQLMDLPAAREVFARTRIGEFSSFAYPFAGHEARVLIDSWVLWTLIIDQLFEEKLASGRLCPSPAASSDPAAVLRAVDTNEPPARHLAVLADLLPRTTKNMSMEWKRQFYDGVALFIRSCHLEATHRMSGTPTHGDLPTFISLRRGSFATALFLDLVEKVYGVSRPTDRAAAELRDCAADLGGWCNDLLSYRRERGREDGNNLVLLLARQHGCPIKDAVREAREHVRERAWQFHDCRAQMLARLREEEGDEQSVADALQWVLGIELLVSGSLTYQRRSRRWQE